MNRVDKIYRLGLACGMIGPLLSTVIFWLAEDWVFVFLSMAIFFILFGFAITQYRDVKNSR